MQRHSQALVLAIAALFVTQRAEAQCPSGVVSRAIGARIDAALADSMLSTLVADFPSEIALPESTFGVFECPSFLDNTTITPRNGQIDLTVNSTEVWIENGNIALRTNIDVSASADLDMIICAAPDAICPATFSTQQLAIEAHIHPDVVECRPDISVEDLVIEVDTESTTVELAECGLYGSVANLAYGWFEESIINLVVDRVSELVIQQAPSIVSSFSDELLAGGVDALGFHVDVALEQILVREKDLIVTLGAAVEATEPPFACAPDVPPIAVTSAELPPTPLDRGDVSVAINKPFVDHIVDMAWRQGWLCLDTRDLELIDLSAPLQLLAPDAQMHALVTTPGRPSASFRPFTDGSELSIEVPSLSVDVSIGLTGGVASMISVNGDAVVRGAVQLDPIDRSLMVVPLSITSEGLNVSTSSGPIVLSEEGIEGVVRYTIMPLLEDNLAPLTLLGGLIAEAPVAISLDHLQATTDEIAVAIDIHQVDPNDREPPETILLQGPTTPTPTRAKFQMSSIDNSPPYRQLRHQVTLDGIAEEELRNGRNIVLSGLTAGPHRVTLAAVDLNGNMDPEPVIVDLIVDDTPPTIELIDAPRGIIRDDEVVIAHRTSDDLSPTHAIRVDYRVGIVAKTAAPDLIIQRGSVLPGEPLVVAGLAEDEVFRVQLTAIDEAGNETTVETGFGVNVEPTWSCAALPGSWMSLLGLFLLLRRRRR